MNKEKTPLILIVNDDGYDAKGLAALVEASREFGEIVVVAPDGVRSGMAHAITFDKPLRLTHLKTEENVTYYKTNGTPVDCVKLGQKVLLKDRKIDLILSGINHGANTSVSLIYSGTMGAAIEGSMENYPSIGFSYADYSADIDFTAAIHFAKNIIQKVLHNPLPDYTSLNVNFPNVPFAEMKGIKITRQTRGHWHEELVEKIDPNGHKYYWATGYLVDKDTGNDTCEWALRNNYISIQPVHFDLTAYTHLETLKHLEQ